VENSAVSKQAHTHSGAFTLTNFRSQLPEQRKNILPVDVSRSRAREVKVTIAKH